MQKEAKNKILDYAIIGNSAAGVSAAENIRKIDKNGNIAIFTSENYYNYSKPLITYYLAGKVSLEKIYFKEKKFYTENNIDLLLNTGIIAIDSKKQIIISSGKEEFSYKKLLIASGGTPVIPSIKITGSNSEPNFINSRNCQGIKGIFTLATLEDAIKLKNYINENKITSAAILGGGLIGLKTAEAMLDLGLQITIIELSDRILSTSFDKNASEIIENKIINNNGNIYTDATIDEIFIKNNKISHIKLRNGKKIECILLVIAIGVKPNSGMLVDIENADNGILVDNFMKSQINNIYAAGDVIKSYDMLNKEQKNIAIWPLAVRQGATAGINMAGGSKEYAGGFFMNSIEILGVPTISIGLNNLDEKTTEGLKIFKQFNPEKNLYRKITIRNDRVIGAILIGNIERAGIYAGLISNNIDVSGVSGNIAREDFGIIQLPAEYRKHLVVGEGIEV